MVRALVLTVSDRSARGERPDETGPRVADRLRDLGHEARVRVVPDEAVVIAEAVLGRRDGPRVDRRDGRHGPRPA